MSTSNVDPSCELRVAKAPIDLAVVCVGTAVVSTFLVLAVRNLLNQVAVVSSALWVAIVACVLIAGIKENGAAGYALRILDGFSRTQVLLVCIVEDSTHLAVGFRLFGINMIQRRIPASDLVSVGWSPGQASDMAGRDVNDWSVALWYSHHDAQKEAWEREHHFRKPGQIPLIIGPQRARVVTEALGQRILGFLQAAGISVTLENEPPSTAA